jgi:uncharacterized protein with HEPN domain
MQDRLGLRLAHIIDAIDQISLLMRSRDFAKAHGDRAIWAAYERFLEIVSEASRHIPADDKAAASNIPWRAVADVGNHLRHVYDGIDPAVLWEIYEKGQLAELRKAVVEIAQRIQYKIG